jgi:DNA-binding protein H-NS
MARTTVEVQLAKLRKAKEALEKKEKVLLARTSGKVIAKIVQLATDNSITIDQIAEAMTGDKPQKARAAKKSSDKRGTAPPKYRNPSNANETWAGRGRPPVWAKAMKDAGTLDTALIQS